MFMGMEHTMYYCHHRCTELASSAFEVFYFEQFTNWANMKTVNQGLKDILLLLVENVYIMVLI